MVTQIRPKRNKINRLKYLPVFAGYLRGWLAQTSSQLSHNRILKGRKIKHVNMALYIFYLLRRSESLFVHNEGEKHSST